MQTKSQAVDIFNATVELVYMVKEEHPQAVSGYLAPMLPSWLQFFYTSLQSGQTGTLQISIVKV